MASSCEDVALVDQWLRLGARELPHVLSKFKVCAISRATASGDLLSESTGGRHPIERKPLLIQTFETRRDPGPAV